MQSCLPDAAIGTNVFTHAYDGIGNHVLGGANAETNTFVANCLNQRVSTRCVQPSSFNFQLEYTADGGLANDGRFAYAYDAEDRLVSVTSLAPTSGAVRVRNEYDWRSRRVAKCVDRYDAGADSWRLVERHDFVWDNWNIVHETVSTFAGAATNVTEVQYFWGPDLSGTLDGAGGVGGLLAVSFNGSFYFPVYDNNGNVMKYVDESGAIVAAYVHDDFGALIAQMGDLEDSLAFGFSTKYLDREVGLIAYQFRYCCPGNGYWLNRDPVEEKGGLNLYCLNLNAPLLRVDAFGFVPLKVVTMRENNLWQRMRNNGDRISWPEISKVDQIEILDRKSSTMWGLFSSSLQTFDCHVEISVQIYINSCVVDVGKKDVTYFYTPHHGRLGGGSSSSDGSPQIRGGVVAHEKGHAKAFFDLVIPGVRTVAESFGNSKLSAADKAKVKATYQRLLKETEKSSGEMANERQLEWYSSHGYDIEVR